VIKRGISRTIGQFFPVCYARTKDLKIRRIGYPVVSISLPGLVLDEAVFSDKLSAAFLPGPLVYRCRGDL
jgi:hypothetical protein